MSITAMDKVFRSDVQPLNARFVLLALADNANDGGYCRPGVAYLSGKTGMSRATVFRALAKLEEDGLLQRRERRRKNGSRRTNAYRIDLDLLDRRRRVITDEEEDELADYFADDDGDENPQVNASSQSDTLRPAPTPPAGKPQVAPSSQPETLGTARSQVETGPCLNLRPLEPSEEPDTPQTPRQAGGQADPPEQPPSPAEVCTEHGRRNCRPCGLSPRAQAWAQRDAAALELAAAEDRGRRCPMCKPDGPARGGGTRWLRVIPGTQVPMTPYDICDHTTPYDDRLRELAERDELAERGRTRTRNPPPAAREPSRAGGRSAAREQAIAVARKVGTRVQERRRLEVPPQRRRRADNGSTRPSDQVRATEGVLLPEDGDR